ncbi:MAG: nucleotide exchange factor GrpE [Acidimicrobiia bacterium]
MSRVPEPGGREPDDTFDEDIAADEAAAVVESDIVELEHERTELVDTLRRVQADFENYRKRVLREQTALVDRATDRIVEELLPVLDSFEGALSSIAADTPEMEKLLDGVNGIRAQLMGVLEKAGLEPIAANDAAFDPNEHEAVLQDEGDAEPRVGETMRTGYRLKGKVIRPAMVKVTRQCSE